MNTPWLMTALRAVTSLRFNDAGQRRDRTHLSSKRGEVMGEARHLHHALSSTLTALILGVFALAPAQADTVRVAVAANFAAPAKAIATAFTQATGHTADLSLGATGKLYAQIKNGAPFDVLLSADAQAPARLVQEKLAVPGSAFTYAIGALVLWSPKESVVDAGGEVLRRGNFKFLALAAPTTAPYGAAAVQTLQKLGLHDALKPQFVQGESLGQTFSFVATGNAELGFLALSQVFEGGAYKPGSVWVVPKDFYSPIRQDAVLLARARDNPAALAFMRFMKTEPVRSVVRAYGYDDVK